LVSHPPRPHALKHAEGSSLFDYHRNRQDLREIRLRVYSHYPDAVSALPLMCQNGTHNQYPTSTHTQTPPCPPTISVYTHINITVLKSKLHHCTNQHIHSNYSRKTLALRVDRVFEQTLVVLYKLVVKHRDYKKMEYKDFSQLLC